MDVDDYSDDDCDYDDAYDFEPYSLEAEASISDPDPEYVEYQCLTVKQIESFVDEQVKVLSEALVITHSLAKLLLHLNHWSVDTVITAHKEDREAFLVKNGVIADRKQFTKRPRMVSRKTKDGDIECAVCFEKDVHFLSLDCQHLFCEECWQAYLKTQIDDGCSTRIECMAPDCHLYCQEDFILKALGNLPAHRSKYEQGVFRDFVSSNPMLRFCPGRDCEMISLCKSNKPHRCICTRCEATYCIKCGQDYHAPATCEILKKWQVKCADDSETANYISAHTKDCPNCHACIEKNGGCNHMQCTKCKHHFCWMCFRDWKSHGSEYYECSRYRENPAVAQEANHLKARRALEKYLHYFERFENHNKSLKMEEELRQRIKQKIEQKVSNHEGTWIDWQYLHDAATLLTKCRYTLQYTYPFAYYMDGDQRKELFEYQQAQLEKEIEELSWKVERAETTDRGDLENQMHVAERKRRTLLQDFFN